MRRTEELEELEAGQPGSVQADRLTFERQPLYKASMHTELQKFGSVDRLSLLDPQPEEEPVQITGLDLTVSQDKALQAIQILLDRTDHEGNRPSQTAHSESYQGHLVPRLAVTFSDYFEAYGLEPVAGGWTKQHHEAIQALHDLAEERWRIVYTRRTFDGGKERWQAIAPERPVSMLTLWRAYKDLETEEVERLKRGDKLPDGRAIGLMIDCNPVLIDQIETFYALKPERLHEEIQALYPGKRVSRTISLFIEWLLTLNLSEITISEDKLLQTLRLYESFYQHRNRSRIRKRINQACEDAQELGYLLDWQKNRKGQYVFKLNSERCRRVKSKRKRGDDHGET
jgi:hypothetical protein